MKNIDYFNSYTFTSLRSLLHLEYDNEVKNRVQILAKSTL